MLRIKFNETMSGDFVGNHKHKTSNPL